MLIDLNQPETWPQTLAAFLDRHHNLFLDWQTREGRCDVRAYDRAIYGLIEELQPFTLKGWHCTRLTEQEICAIVEGGLHLPNAESLYGRINALTVAQVIAFDVAATLKAKNQADDPNRSGMVWFCFFPPRLAGQGGIERFFRHWGGEALYNSHERDPVIFPVLARIGTPCVIEADVPIESLEPKVGLSFEVVRRFLFSRGHQTPEPVRHEGRIVRPLPAANVRRIVRFPDADFLDLTGAPSDDAGSTSGCNQSDDSAI